MNLLRAIRHLLTKLSHASRTRVRLSIAGGVALLLIVAILGYQADSIFANVKSLTPNTCTGDWEGASTLVGKDNRMAVASEDGQKVFCTFPMPSERAVPLTRAVVAFSFEPAFVPEPPSSEDPVLEEDTTEEGGEEGEVLGTEEIVEEDVEEVPSVDSNIDVPLEETVEEELPLEEAQAEESPVEEPVTEEAPVEETAPEEAPIEAVSRAPSFFSWFFASSVHAQETEETSSVEAESVPEEEVLVENTTEEVTPPTNEEAEEASSVVEEASQEDVTPSEEVSNETPIGSDEELVVEEESGDEEVEDLPEGEVLGVADEVKKETLLTLSYTLNGARWVDLTTFSPQGNEVTFDIDLASTADLEKLVVRLTADAVGEENIVLTGVEIRMHTEAPFDQLLEELGVPLDAGAHVYTKKFVIDPKAEHSCSIEPSRLSATETSFFAQLRTKDSLSLTDETEVLEESSPTEIASSTSEEDLELEPEKIVEELVIATSTSEEEKETLPGEVAGVAVLEESVTGTEEVLEPGIVEKALDTGATVLAAVGETAEDLLDGALIEPRATLEIGSLPTGVDVRFLQSGNYQLAFEDEIPLEVPLTLSIVDPATAQKGSFSVPLIYTWKKGKDSTVVCLMNIVNIEDHE